MRRPPTPAPTLTALPPDSLAWAFLRAAEVLVQVMAGRNLDNALANTWQTHADTLTPAQRGAVQDLAYGVLRQYGRGDFLLNRLLREPLDDAGDKPMLRALLLAAFYRLEMRPDDAHTTVDQAVGAVARLGRGQFKALANAVLRNRLRQSDALLAAAREDELARWQHPHWWVEKLRATYPGHWQAILECGNTHPPMTLRVNRLRGSRADYLAALAEAGLPARESGHGENDVALQLERPAGVDKLPGFFEGRVSVQDKGAQQAAQLLDVQAGQRVLDACAAPGGKTTHILELAAVDLLALDAEPARAARIEDNLSRLGLTARVKAADCRKLDDWWDGRPFDRILVDAPCSASGVVRRHPDIKWLRREKDISGFARLQREILDALWRVLAPGGKMLYCTCSLFPLENSAQIDAFLHRHANARCLPLALTRDTLPGAVGSPPFLQLIPQAEHDGFFHALLQKAP